MRFVVAILLTAATGSGAISADLRSPSHDKDGMLLAGKAASHASRRVISVRRSSCIKCLGSLLPLGGLRTTYNARLPLGGFGSYCPPELENRQIVLVRKG